jgi:hypothetical protein
MVSVCHRGQAYFHVYRNMVNSRLKQRGRGPRWLIWLLGKYGVWVCSLRTLALPSCLIAFGLQFGPGLKIAGPRWLIWLLGKYGVFEFTSIHRDG